MLIGHEDRCYEDRTDDPGDGLADYYPVIAELVDQIHRHYYLYRHFHQAANYRSDLTADALKSVSCYAKDRKDKEEWQVPIKIFVG